MLRLPPRSTRTDTPFPYTTLFRSDVAGRSAGVRPHALPEFSLLLRRIERKGLGRGHPGDEPIGDQRPGEAAHQGEQHRADPDPQRVDAAIVRDPRTDAAPFGVLLVEIEFGAAGRHLSSSCSSSRPAPDPDRKSIVEG